MSVGSERQATGIAQARMVMEIRAVEMGTREMKVVPASAVESRESTPRTLPAAYHASREMSSELTGYVLGNGET